MRPGQVIHTIFLLSTGSPDAFTESRQETWELIGPDGGIKQSRVRLYDATGRLDQEGFGDGDRGKTVNVQFVANRTPFPGTQLPAQIIRTTPRPRAVRAVMWTAESVRLKLEGAGFRTAGAVTIAGLQGTRYEERSQIVPDASVRYPAPASELRTLVRRAYVGRDPFGVDLGEEAGYEDARGKFYPAVYRKLVRYEVVDAAPAGTFEWPYGFAEQVPQTRGIPRELAESTRRQQGVAR